MYFPNFITKNNGVPILSKKVLDIVAENFIKDFKPQALIEPQAIDVDDFAFNYLGLNQDFHYLSHDESVLGAMVFRDSVIPVYNPHENKAEYVLIDANTVVIDSGITEANQESRYRYTVGHEAGHAVLHKLYFYYKSLYTNHNQGILHMNKCLEEAYTGNKPGDQWGDMDFIEWQANYFSAALLMPKSMVVKVLRDLKVKDSFFKEEEYVHAISKVFKVSWDAAANRLNTLGFIISADRVKIRKNIYLDFVADL